MDAKKRYWRTISTITYGPDGSCLSSTPVVREEYDPEEEERRRAAEPVGDRVTYVYDDDGRLLRVVRPEDVASGGDPPPGPAG